MSRSGYSDDLDQWALIRWRGAVAAAIRGKRGQALLKEMEAALLALPEKVLCAGDFAKAADGEVCALGSVALKRKLDKGKDLAQALQELEKEFPEDTAAEEVHAEFGIAEALAKEITYVNDEHGPYGCTPQQRYEVVLAWVREQIKKE
jgi:hypothetical protein